MNSPRSDAEQAKDGTAEDDGGNDIESPLGEQSEALLAQYTGVLDQSVVLDAVEDTIRGIENTLRPFNEIGEKYGLDGEQMVQDVESIKAAFVQQAEDAVRGMGEEPEVVFRWAGGFYSQSYLNEIKRRHYTEGNLSGYKALAEAYRTRHPKGGERG